MVREEKWFKQRLLRERQLRQVAWLFTRIRYGGELYRFLLPFLLYDAPVFLGIGRGKVLSWKYRCRRHRNLFSGPSRLALIQEEISVKDARRVSVQRKELKCYKTNLWITIIEKRKNYDWVMNPRRRDRTTETSLRSMRTYLAIATATTPRKFRGVYQKEH